MLLQHEFFEDTHEYIIPGRTVISTSDVIQLAGLSNFDGIPKAVLDNARWRGQQIDSAIKGYEQCLFNGTEEYALNWIYDQMEGDLAEIRLQFEAYRIWKQVYKFEPIFPMDKSLVYGIQHYQENDLLIGGTRDLLGFITMMGQQFPVIVDIKATSRLYGMKLKQKQLAWRMQLESYLMATEEDNEFMDLLSTMNIGKRILQLNPAFKDTGYCEHVFDTYDDRAQWIGLALNAQSKIEAGILPERR